MIRTVRVFLIACVLLFGGPFARPTVAQQVTADSAHAGPTHLLKTRDGSVLLGRLVAESPDTILFQTSGGVLVLPRSSVVELRRIDAKDVHDGTYWSPDPNTTRLFFAPTGRMLQQGEGYFNDTYLFFLSAEGGITDRLTLGGGLSVFPTPDFSQNVFYLTPKVGLYQGGDVSLAAGALIGFAGESRGSGGIVYGVGTKGGPDASVTLGTGWLYGGTQVESKPVFMLGGTKRIARHVSLVTENYVQAGSQSTDIVSYGLRLFGDKLSVDLAFWNSLGHDATKLVPGVPYVAFSTRF